MWKMRLSARHQTLRRFKAFAITLICAVFLSHLLTSAVFAEDDIPVTKTKSPTKDVRILIDISGSMKKTDPNNLRQPAVKLFASLLPDNVLSGVWTFGKWVNMLIPHGNADVNWKASARQQATRINSNGLFTNIEEALRRSTWDWKEYNPEFERTLIILSDGMVDISNNPVENNESRSRIQGEILTRMTNAKVKIHTIALSSLSDKSLLQKLSTATEGIHETIESTSELDKVFMRIFDAATPRDELPLLDNKVKVDNSIREITFLAFRKDKSTKTTIISPSNFRYDQMSNNGDLTWHSENRYDLVTIKKPESGTWTVEADVDPDNRVMVVTDLRLITSRLPDIALAGDIIPINAHLESKDEIIKQRDFLHFVRMTANHYDENENKLTSLKLKDNGKGVDDKKRDGIFSTKTKKTNITGRSTIELVANGTTFKRKSTQQIDFVKYPVSHDITITKNNEIFVSIIPYQSLVDAKSLVITAKHTLPDNSVEQYSIKKTSSSEWSETFSTNNLSGTHNIIINTTGKMISGDTFDVNINIDDIALGDNVENDIDKEKESTEQIPELDLEEESANWMIVTLSVLMFNILLLLLVFSTYKIWGIYKYKLIPHPCKELTSV